MSLGQLLKESGAIESMAGELGIDSRSAQMGAAILLPAILAGLGRSSTDSTGLGSLANIVGSSAGSGGLLDLVLGKQPTPTQHGNEILGNIFGNKDVSRSVASEAAAASGLDESILKKMLPILAMAAAGYLVTKQDTQGPNEGLGGLLGTLAAGLRNRT